MLGWQQAQECRSTPGNACARSQGSARSTPGDREGVIGSLGKQAPVALPPIQAMLCWVIFNPQLQASRECRAGVRCCLWLSMPHGNPQHQMQWYPMALHPMETHSAP